MKRTTNFLINTLMQPSNTFLQQPNAKKAKVGEVEVELFNSRQTLEAANTMVESESNITSKEVTKQKLLEILEKFNSTEVDELIKLFTSSLSQDYSMKLLQLYVSPQAIPILNVSGISQVLTTLIENTELGVKRKILVETILSILLPEERGKLLNKILYGLIGSKTSKDLAIGIVKVFVEIGVDLNQTIDYGVMHYFAKYHDDPEMLKFLIDNGAQIDLQDYLGRTPLLLSIGQDGTQHVNLSNLKFLLDKGADINHSDNEGWTLGLIILYRMSHAKSCVPDVYDDLLSLFKEIFTNRLIAHLNNEIDTLRIWPKKEEKVSLISYLLDSQRSFVGYFVDQDKHKGKARDSLYKFNLEKHAISRVNILLLMISHGAILPPDAITYLDNSIENLQGFIDLVDEESHTPLQNSEDESTVEQEKIIELKYKLFNQIIIKFKFIKKSSIQRRQIINDLLIINIREENTKLKQMIKSLNPYCRSSLLELILSKHISNPNINSIVKFLVVECETSINKVIQSLNKFELLEAGLENIIEHEPSTDEPQHQLINKCELLIKYFKEKHQRNRNIS